MDELGVEAVLQHPGLVSPYRSRDGFLIKKLTEGEG